MAGGARRPSVRGDAKSDAARIGSTRNGLGTAFQKPREVTGPLHLQREKWRIGDLNP